MNVNASDNPLARYGWPVTIFLIALIFRLLFFYQAYQLPLFDIPFMDMEYHFDWAKAIAENRPFIDGPFFRAPLYPYFVSLCFTLFGPSLLILMLMQSLMSALSVVLVYSIGKDVFNRETGVVAGLMAAMYGPMIFFTGLLLIPTLAIFLNLSGVYSLLRYSKTKRYLWLIFSGISFGLSAIAIPTVLLFTAGVIVLFLCNKREHLTSRVKRTVLYGLAVLLPILPVTIHNYRASGEFTLIGTYGGMNFYIGNNVQSDGVSARLPGARKDWWGMMEDAKRQAETAKGRTLTANEQSGYWTDRTLTEIFSEPWTFAKLMVKKTILLMEGLELSNNFDFYYFARQVPVLRLLIWPGGVYFPYGIIFPLAVVGFLVSVRSQSARLLLIFVSTYSAGVILFFVTSRYRLPIVPFLIIPAAYALTAATNVFMTFDKRRTIRYTVVLLGLLLLSNTDLYGLKPQNKAQGHYLTAVLESKAGDNVNAAFYYHQTIKQDHTFAEAYNNLALIVAADGKGDSALMLINRAYQLDSQNIMIKYNCGYLHLTTGKADEALPFLESVVREQPDNLYAANNLGLALLETDRANEAIGAFQKAVLIDAGFVDGYFNAALCFREINQLDSAASYFREVIYLNPGEPSAYYHLGMIFHESQAADSARIYFVRYLELAPQQDERAAEVQGILKTVGN